jgi:acyl carrier protein
MRGEIEIEGTMEYRALIASSLMDIGVDVHGVQQIESGAMIYGDAGLLDSVYLVALIAAIEEKLTVALDAPVDLFRDRGVALVDEFKDVQTLASFLEDRVTGNATARECWEIKR